MRSSYSAQRSKTILISLLLLFVLVLTSCAPAPAGTTSTTAPAGSSATAAPQPQVQPTVAQTPAEPEAPYEITIFMPFFQQEPPATEGNPLLDYVHEKLNIKLIYNWVPNGEVANKFNVLMASNEMSMIMSGGTTAQASFVRLANLGSFWDITEMVEEFPVITEKLMNPATASSSLLNGRRYFLPSQSPDARIGMLYREDWVENLGMTLPDNLSSQDFYDLCKAFTEGDPDGDGKNDTSGYAYCDDQNKETAFGFTTIAVFNGAPNGFGIRDGKIIYDVQTQEYLDTLNLMNDMYENGYLISDFATLSSGAKYNPMLEERAGLMFTSITNAAVPGGKFDTLLATNPDAKIGVRLLNVGVDGNLVVNSNIGVSGGGLVLTTAKVKTEDDVRRILDFFSQLHSGDLAKAVDIGIEGVHYTTEANGKITITPEQAEKRAVDGSKLIFWDGFPRRMIEEDWGQEMSPTQLLTQMSIDKQQYAVRNEAGGRISSESLTIMNEIEGILIDARVAYIMGRIDETGFNRAVDEWLAAGGADVIAEVQANYEAETK